MQIFEERIEQALVVAIDDHLDTSAAPAFETRLIELIDSGERQLVIDCSALEYVNSAGLKVFLLAAKKIEPLGGKMVLCALAPSVFAIFEMIGFTRIMKIVKSREEAFAFLAEAPANS